MSLESEKYAQELDLTLRAFENENFKAALNVSGDKTFLNLINDIDFGVINIWGQPGLGKTFITHKLAHLFWNKGKAMIVDFDFKSAYNYISKNKVLIVRQGYVEKVGKDEADNWGAEQYLSFASRRQGIVLIISTQKLTWSINFSIEALGKYRENEQQFHFGMLYIKERPVGYLQFGDIRDTEFLDAIEELTSEARLEYHKTEMQRIKENIAYSTQELIKFMTIPKQIIFAKKKSNLRKTENAIIPLKILIYGDIYAGKSTLLEVIHNQFETDYGPENVHSFMHEYDLGILMQEGFTADKSKFIQMIAVEDATYALPAGSDISHDWINLRHTLNERTGGSRKDRSAGIQQAYVIAILLLHKLRGGACPIEYRQSFDLQFFLDIPTNKSDRDYIRDLMDSGIYWDFLKQTVAERTRAKQSGDVERYLSLLGIGVCITKEGIFAFRFNLDTFKASPIPLLDKWTSWKADWIDLAFSLAGKYSGYEKPPPNFILDNEITLYEVEQYGRIRPASEGRINYRTRTINYAKALIGSNFLNRTNQPINPPTPRFFTSENDYPLDLMAIIQILLIKFSQVHGYEESMKDYIQHTMNLTNREIAKKFDKNNATVSQNINAIRERLYKSSDTGGIGFIFEHAVFIYAFKLYESVFGSAVIKILDQQNNLVKESTELIERDYSRDRNYAFTVSPPTYVTVQNLAPTLREWFEASGHDEGEISGLLPQLRWMGGWSEDDFTIEYVDDDGPILSAAIECKASTVRTKAISLKKPGCECRIRKVHEGFEKSGGWIFHFHPWEFKAVFAVPGKIPPSMGKGSGMGRGVLDDLLLINKQEKQK